MIPFIDLKTQYAVLKPEIDARIQQVLDHGQYIMGPEVAELEARLGELVGRECITVASGTEALLIALMALGIGPGDEVITSPFTFVSTGEVIALVGATPVYVDVEPDTCNLDARKLEARITPRTKAIMPVSLYGQTADMDAIADIARRHGDIPVIEDAAQSFGARYRDRPSCGLSRIGCTSFFPSKPLGCYGDGGAIFTDDAQLARAMREIRVHGQEKRYFHTRIGVGGRMDTLQCAVVLAKLDRFEWEIDRRIALGARYTERLRAAGVQTLTVRPERTCVWGQYTVLVDDREALRARLDARKVPTAVHYPRPLHLQPAYAAFHDGHDLSVSETVAHRVLSLPMSPDLTEVQQDMVIEALLAELAVPA